MDGSLGGPDRAGRPSRGWSGPLAASRDLTTEQVSTQVRAWVAAAGPGAAPRLGVSTGIHGWRYFYPDLERGRLPTRITCPTATRPDLDRRITGIGEVTWDPVWPFLSSPGDTGAEEAAALADNLEALLSVVTEIVAAVEPSSIRLHTDAGSQLPFNAHVSYYRDAAAVLADVAWIVELWEHGAPRHGIAPLVPPTRPPDDWALHAWRTADQRRDLRDRLGRLVEAAPKITAGQVADLRIAGTCPVSDCGPGLLVLGGEGCVNGFVDPFLTELADLT